MSECCKQQFTEVLYFDLSVVTNRTELTEKMFLHQGQSTASLLRCAQVILIMTSKLKLDVPFEWVQKVHTHTHTHTHSLVHRI